MSQDGTANSTTLGDKGGQGARPEISREDMTMIARAIRAEWKIPQTVLDALPSQIAKMFVEQTSPRAKMSAAKLLIQMAGENRATAHLAIQATQGQTPLVQVNGNVTVETGSGEDDKRKHVAEVVGELQRLGFGIGERPPAVQPAPADAETESVPDSDTDEPVS